MQQNKNSRKEIKSRKYKKTNLNVNFYKMHENF